MKWDQPSYPTAQTKSGTTIRIDALESESAGYAFFCHCQTTLIATIRAQFGTRFRYEGQRAIHFIASEPVPETDLRECILLALTSHASKRTPPRPIGERIRNPS